MKKLLQGVVNFHENVLPGMRAEFARLAHGQSPDVLMIACSDSRVVPNLFASTDPGDLFVVRNPGNLVPPVDATPHGSSEAAAIAIALDVLQVTDVIVCGHSGCAGMSALLASEPPPLAVRQWMAHGVSTTAPSPHALLCDDALSPPDQLSQHNVLYQLAHVATYPRVCARVADGALRLHGWWFDVATGNVFAFEPAQQRFVIIDAAQGQRMLERLGMG